MVDKDPQIHRVAFLKKQGLKTQVNFSSYDSAKDADRSLNVSNKWAGLLNVSIPCGQAC